MTDTLLLAHTLVAQATIYLKEYKVDEFIRCNKEAAQLYGAIDRNRLEIKSYTNALDGYVIKGNKLAADSLVAKCKVLVQKNSDGLQYLFTSMLSYIVEFGSSNDVKAFLDAYQDVELNVDEKMSFALGYSKIGEYDKALAYLDGVNLSVSTMDSLRYFSVKIKILDKQGKYEQALNEYKKYAIMRERHQSILLSQDLLFADQKHKMEVKNLKEIHDKNLIIGSVLAVC